MSRIVSVLLVLIFVHGMAAYAAGNFGSAAFQGEKIGEGRLTYLFMDIYDATLYAPDGEVNVSGPLALQLNYLRDIKSHKIVNRSIDEMKRLGVRNPEKLERWRMAMAEIFPDVNDQTVLTGIYTQEGETVFLENGSEIGRIEDPEFGYHFFNIWLSENTSAPDLRRKLLGQHE